MLLAMLVVDCLGYIIDCGMTHLDLELSCGQGKGELSSSVFTATLLIVVV